MSALFTLPNQQVFDEAGDMLMGAKANFYIIATSTRKNTYIDAALTEAHPNPVEADAFGVFPPIWLDESGTDYRMVLTDQFDVVQHTIDGLLSATTPQDLLDAIQTVDGDGSGLDADLLDGHDGSEFGIKAENETVTGEWNFAPGMLVGGFQGGYAGLPINEYTSQHTIEWADFAKAMSVSTGGWVIPVLLDEPFHVNEDFPTGFMTVCYNDSGVNQSITAETPATTTIRLAATASTGTRVVAARGVAVLWYRGANNWHCWGIGVS